MHIYLQVCDPVGLHEGLLVPAVLNLWHIIQRQLHICNPQHVLLCTGQDRRMWGRMPVSQLIQGSITKH